jgi:hypothetical protein
MTDVSFYAALKHFTQTQKIGGNPMKAQQRFFSFSRHGFHFLLFLVFSIYLLPKNGLFSVFHLAGRCCYTSAEQLLRVPVVNNSVMKTPGPSLSGGGLIDALLLFFILLCFVFRVFSWTPPPPPPKKIFPFFVSPSFRNLPHPLVFFFFHFFIRL